MKKAIHIPAHMIFDGTVPASAADLVLAELEVAENTLSEFQKARIGKITASNFGMVKKLKTSGQWGDMALSYLYDIIGEHLTGEPAEKFTGNKATDWGEMYEEEAIHAYTKRTGKKTQPAQVLKHPSLTWVGATPDRFVGEKGLIEAKCPLTFKNHLRTVITRAVPDEYLPQVYGQLWLSGREWCDFISYDPRIKKSPHNLAIVRVWRKEHSKGIANTEALITEFHELLLNKLEKLKVEPGQNFNF